RNDGPVGGDLIGRESPDEENDQRCRHEKEARESEAERPPLPPTRQRQQEIEDERGEQDDAEKGPSAIDALDDEVLVSAELHLVRQLEEVRTGGSERQRREDDGQDLKRSEAQRLLRRAGVSAVRAVPGGHFAGGRLPYPVALDDSRECPVEIADAVRLPGEPGMNAQREDAAGWARLLMQIVECVDDHVAPPRR